MNLKLVYLVAALEHLTFGLMVPVINPHLGSLGSSFSAIGFMNSVTAFVLFICNPLIGSLSDTTGRKSTLLKTLALGVFSNFLLGQVYTSYVGVFIYRILHAISSQTMVLLKALIADRVDSDKQAAVYGNLGAVVALGFILGPIISGVVLETKGGFYNLSLLMTALTITSFVISLFLPEDSTPTKRDKKQNEKQLSVIGSVQNELAKVANNFRAISWNLFWDVFVLKLMLEISFTSFYSSFGLVLINDFAFTQKQVGYMLAFHASLFVVLNPLYAHLKRRFYSSDKIGDRRIRHSFLLLVVSFIGFTTAPNWWMYGFFMVPISAVRVLADSTFTEILMLRTGKEEKGTVMGAFESLMSLSGLTAPLIMGFATDVWGHNAPSFIALIPSTISIYIANKMQKVSEKYTQ